MPLGPSGCILRASLVGDAHKYVFVWSNVCAAVGTPFFSFYKLLKLLCLVTQMRPVHSLIDSQYWDSNAIYGAPLVQITQLTGTNCRSVLTGACGREFRCEIASKTPSIAKEVMRDQPPWLTNGSVMPVIGSTRRTPPMFTSP